jgi:NADPH:quinone reductase-like Zn-dependent oxidoreductase
MKAIRIHAFGGPEVMQLEEIERPVPEADEILVKVYAASINPADYIVRRGGNDLLRPYLQLPLGLGLDAAGVVEEVGHDVTTFKKGDKVYGVPNLLEGAYAEYIAAKASQFARMPANLSFNEAGAIPSCALIAWSGIMDLGKAGPGQRVLVHGAAGGVGTLAVQFAQSRGAYVITTASPHNFDFLKTLGADETIDYTHLKNASSLHNLDLVFNASPVRDEEVRVLLAKSLRTEGIFICSQLDSPFSEELQQVLIENKATGNFVGGGKMGYDFRLDEVAALIAAGKVKAVVSKVYPLEKVAEAHRECETKHVRGKLVLEIHREDSTNSR